MEVEAGVKKERERGGRGGGEGEVKRGGVVERPPWSGSGRVVAGCREVVAEATPVEVVAEVVAKVTPVVTLVEVVLVTEVVAKVTPVESWLPAVAEEEAPLAAADLLDLPLPAPRRPRLDDGTLGTGSSGAVPPPRLRKRSLRRQPEDGSTCDMI